MVDVAEQHRREVARGGRFEFGKNWARFLKRLTPKRIELAESSLREFLQVDRLDGKTFIDIGSGSGLFSLCARRLGARVHSFDYDSSSVACSREMRRRFFPDDPNWVVEQGSVLDRTYLASLGRFDIVYSWGVLHHTGQMWQAIENVKPLVAVGGTLYIAIYNDQGPITDEWARIKQRYNALPRPLAALFALKVFVTVIELPEAWRTWRSDQFPEYLRRWTEYDKLSTRGMSHWHDAVDWIGGYPYERATVERIVEFCARDGFRLTKLADRSEGYGCNEFVFRRLAPAGVYVESRIPGGSSLAGRFGHMVTGPFVRGADGRWTGRVMDPPELGPGDELLLIRDEALVGPVSLLPGNHVPVADGDIDPVVFEECRLSVVVAERRPLVPPFVHHRGSMWEMSADYLADLADSMDNTRGSPLFLFEDGRPLVPHSYHDDIATRGAGRFSHWGNSIFFSPTDNSDPSANGREYVGIVPVHKLPRERSCAQSWGQRLAPPFIHTARGWVASVHLPEPAAGEEWYLFRDDRASGAAPRDDEGRIVVADTGEPEERVIAAEFHVVCARAILLPSPFDYDRGLLWACPMPELGYLAGSPEAPRHSSVFLFENGYPLPRPHTDHDIIAKFGRGGYSHWGETIYFSTLAGTNPNDEGCEIVAIIPADAD